MPYDPHKHHRRSIRLRGYDYSTPGAYLVTIVTHGRLCLFGDVVDGRVRLNDAGRMVERVWQELPERFPFIGLDPFVVMPNHLHGIIVIMEQGDHRDRPYDESTGGAETRRGEPCVRPEYEPPTGTEPETIGRIVQDFKTGTTNAYVRGVRRLGWTPFEGHLWQRSYHDHITRHDDDLFVKRRYVANNPFAWADDAENPSPT